MRFATGCDSPSPMARRRCLDAINLAIDSMKPARNPRRALLILSDGGDNDSRYTQTELLSRVREADLWIYAMGIYDRYTATCPRKHAPRASCWKLSPERAAGGISRWRRWRNYRQLPPGSGWNCTISTFWDTGPNVPRRDGKYHRVQVKMAEGRRLTVSSRPGYYGTVE